MFRLKDYGIIRESMNKYPQANKVGVFRKLLSEDWLVQSYSGGMRYAKNNAVLQSSVDEPFYSYGHNYSKFDKDFSLFMWTTEKNKEKVSDFFDSIVEDLTEEQVKRVIEKKDRFLYAEREYSELT